MNTISINMLLFSLSIAFQLAGALLLLLNSLSKHRLEANSYGEPALSIENGILYTEFSKTKEERDIIDLRIILLNRFSFSYLAIGYFLSIFSNNAGNKAIIVIMVLAISFLLLFIAEMICLFSSKRKAL